MPGDARRWSTASARCCPARSLRVHARRARRADRFWSAARRSRRRTDAPTRPTLRRAAARAPGGRGRAAAAARRAGRARSSRAASTRAWCVALARRLARRPVHTYSVSFGPDYRERAAVQLAGGRALRHRPPRRRAVAGGVAAPPRRHDRPARASRSATRSRCRTRCSSARPAREVGVVLNGEGGDPCFGGPKNLPMLLAELLRRRRRPGRRRAGARAQLPARAPEVLRRPAGDARARRRATRSPAAPLEARADAVLRRPALAAPSSRGCRRSTSASRAAHHILPKVDALSAPFGVLPRSPLFDRAGGRAGLRASRRSSSCAARSRSTCSSRRSRDLLPAAILDRPKSGMLVPVEGWFRGPLLPQARARLLDGLAPYELFRRAYLERLLAGSSAACGRATGRRSGCWSRWRPGCAACSPRTESVDASRRRSRSPRRAATALRASRRSPSCHDSREPIRPLAERDSGPR